MITKEDLPDDWKIVNLKDYCMIFNGITPSTEEQKKEGHPILKIKDINENGYFKGKFDSYVDDVFFHRNKVKCLEDGDTIILNAAHNSEYVGSKKAYISGFQENVIPTGEWLIVRSNSEFLDNQYKHFFLTSNLLKLELKNIVKGIHLYPKDVKNLEVPLPPLPTQKKIAAVLEKAEKLREWRKEADGLTDRFLKSTFLEMFGDPIKNPKKWELVKFAKVGSLKRGKSKHRPRDAPELLGGPYPLIQTGDVANSGGYIRKYDQTYSELGLIQSKMWPSGTLCITIAANIAKTGILTFDSCFPDSVVGFIPHNNTKTEYVQFWLSFLQKMLEETAPESAQKNINLEILSNLNIPFPPFELQQRFASIVQQVEEVRQHQKESKVQIDHFFNVLMQKAFNGGVT